MLCSASKPALGKEAKGSTKLQLDSESETPRRAREETFTIHRTIKKLFICNFKRTIFSHLYFFQDYPYFQLHMQGVRFLLVQISNFYGFLKLKNSTKFLIGFHLWNLFFCLFWLQNFFLIFFFSIWFCIVVGHSSNLLVYIIKKSPDSTDFH